ncbi:hypothetical protein HOY80DRAFT_873151, partial [Tuber brumale]
FADGNIVADLMAEKRNIDEQGDEVIDTRIPRWGSWTGPGANGHKEKCGDHVFHGDKIVNNTGRNDFIINNGNDLPEKAKFQASPLTFRCECQQQYECRLCIPIFPEW